MEESYSFINGMALTVNACMTASLAMQLIVGSALPTEASHCLLEVRPSKRILYTFSVSTDDDDVDGGGDSSLSLPKLTRNCSCRTDGNVTMPYIVRVLLADLT